MALAWASDYRLARVKGESILAGGCVNVDKVIGGRIVEHGGAANMLGPLLKIGAVKVVGAEDAHAQ